MYDKNKVMTGIVIFLVVVLFPVWFTIGSGSAGDKIEPELATMLEAVKKDPAKSHCVEDVEYMRAFHMDLLNRWRNEVVREGDRTYASRAFDGATYEKSLTRTCLMQCHTGASRKADFCDRCHEYSDATPNCWACHVDPELGVAVSGAPGGGTTGMGGD